MKDREFVVEKIRSQYTEQHLTELDELKALDAKAKRPANVFGYIYGSIGTIVMGAGMSLVMTDIGSMLGMKETLVPGFAVGIAGMALVALAYPVYKRVLRKHRARIAPKVLKLADELMN